MKKVICKMLQIAVSLKTYQCNNDSCLSIDGSVHSLFFKRVSEGGNKLRFAGCINK